MRPTPRQMGTKSLSVLHHLAKHGVKNRLELERELGTAQMADCINKLKANGHVTSLPKVRGELMRYQITATGRQTIGLYIQKQESLKYRPVSELPLYVPKEMPVRPGSMTAYSLPSRGMR